VSWLTALCRRMRIYWSASFLRAHIAQLEMGLELSRPDLRPIEDAAMAPLYAAHIAELHCELAVLEAQA
jgi:hypothetical protein